MKLSKADIYSLIDTGRIDEMPANTFVDGFEDFDGKYYPISEIDADFFEDRVCEMYTYLTHADGGIVFYLRFFF